MTNGKYETPNSRKKMAPWVWLGMGVGLVILAAVICLVAFSGDNDPSKMPEQNIANTTPTEPSGQTEPPITDFTENTENTNNTEDTEQAFTVNLTEESDSIRVTTRYGTLAYSAAFSDVVQIRTKYIEDVAVLKFEGLIGDDRLELFDVCYGEMDGDTLKQISLEDGSVVNASLVVYEPPQNLSKDDLNTYYAAQEILNDVISSIMEEQ